MTCVANSHEMISNIKDEHLTTTIDELSGLQDTPSSTRSQLQLFPDQYRTQFSRRDTNLSSLSSK